MAVSHAKSNTVANWTGTVTVGNSTGGTQTIAATDLVRPADWNSAHNQFYTLTGNTTNASTASGSNVVFGASGKAIISGSSDSVIVSVPNTMLSHYMNAVPPSFTQISAGGGSSNHVFSFLMPQDGSFNVLRMVASMSLASTTFATGAAGYGSSVAQSNTLWFNIYTKGTGASSQSLQYLTQASTTWAFQISYSGTASTHSVSYNLTYPVSLGVSSTTQMTSSQQSSAVNEVPAATSAFNGYRFFEMPFAVSLSAGNYYGAIQRSSTTAGGSNINLGISIPIHIGLNSTAAILGDAANATNAHLMFVGSWSTNTVGATTSSIARSGVSSNISNYFPVFHMYREA